MCLLVILRWIVNALILMIIPFMVPGVEIRNFCTALIFVNALAFVNTIIRPILIILTLPINILTLGLFTLIINTFMFWLAASFVKGFGAAGFWPAFFAALIYSVISMIINHFTRDKKERGFRKRADVEIKRKSSFTTPPRWQTQ